MKDRNGIQSNNLPKPIDFSKNEEVSNEDIQRRYEEYSRERSGDYETQKIPDNSFIEKQFDLGNNKDLSEKYNENIKNSNNIKTEAIKSFIPASQINPNINLNITPKNQEPKEFKYASDLDDKINFPEVSPDLNMEPDDYDINQLLNPIEEDKKLENLISDENNDNQFRIETKNDKNDLDDVIPSSIIENSKALSLENIPKQQINVDLTEITELIKKQQDGLENTNEKINSLVNVIEKQDIDKFYQTIIDIPNLIKMQQNNNYTIKKHSLIISSRDRELSNSEFNKYNFKVNFGGSLNDTSVRDNFNTNNNSKNDSQLKNNTETIKKYTPSVSNNLAVSNILRNVVSLKITRVIIPRPRDHVYFPEPYYFIAIDEFESNIITTKQFNEKILCKIHFDKELVFGGIGDTSIPNIAEDGNVNANAGDDNGRKYLYYKNEDDEKINFYHSPLAKLNNLTIKILDSRGRSLSDTWKDVDFISNVERTGDGTNTPFSFGVNENFINNSFLKDEIRILNNDTNFNESRINGVNTSTNKIILPDDIGENNNNNTLINLTNQIEYVFEIHTKEHDIDANFKSEIL